MQKEKQVVHQLTVYDADEDKLVEVSKEQQLEAMAVFQQIQAGVFISALGIKRMVDKKLYLAMNIQSKDQFLSTLEAFGRRQAYKLLAVATKFENVFGERLLAMNTAGSNTDADKFNGMGIEKLYEITRLDDAEIVELSEGGEVEIGDQKMSLDDIKSMGFRELEKQFSKAKKKMQDELSLMNEENKLLKEEIKLKNKQIETADQKMEDAKELEIKYGPAAKTIANKDFLLKECMDNLNEFNDYIIKANVLANDPERIRKQLTDIVKKMNTVAKIVNEAYQEITVDF